MDKRPGITGLSRILSKAVVLIFIASLLGGFLVKTLPAAPAQLICVISVEGTVEPGQAKYIARSYREAEMMQADLVVLEIDTPGGRVDAALEISDTIRHSSVSSVALVKGRAISAGALIALSCKNIAMEPGSTIGAAEPRVGTEPADEKYISYFAKEMAAVAESNGRNPDIAVAMVDRDKEIPGLVEKGKLLTLTYQEAEKHGYTDYVVNGRGELLDKLEMSGAQVVEVGPSVSETITRLVTNPYVAPILLTVGIAGIIIEVFTVGWGVAGTLGILALGLYFGGHLLAGFTGWGVILLFIVGIILLGVEALMPGFGVFGLGGIICMAVSIVLAAPGWEAGIISLTVALAGTIVLVLLSFKLLSKRKFWDRLVLGTKYKKEDGYISQAEDMSKYVGLQGEAYTILRPAGTMILEDGTRLDVVTDGEYIPKGQKIAVIRVEGIRIVVQAAKE